ncbi:MAG: VOC family protein [Candidatus Sericytochromatia bacterium]|nr:VOC family protein [Candidatus Tanganyikabacteria bacterium]
MTTATAQETKPEIAYGHGDFCHIELPYQDHARVKKFYGEAFGWTFQDMPEMDYTMFLTPNGRGGVQGGLYKATEEMKSAVNYINVDNLQASNEKIAALGGKILKDRVEVPGMGELSIVMDTEGNVFGLWHSTSQN